MRRLWWAWCLGAVLLAGCAPSQAARDQIRIARAVSEANLREWDRLTDAQRLTAAQRTATAFRTLDEAINGTAPVTSGP